MHKTIVFSTWYTGLGGGETALLALAGQLDPARWRPHLLVPREDQLSVRWRAQGWPLSIVPFRGASTWFVPALYARFPAVRRFEAVLRASDAAAVYSDYHSLPFALPAARRTGALASWICWGWWFRPRPWQRRFFRQPEVSFAASWAVRDGFLGSPPFMPPDRLPVLPPGVDTDRFRPGVDGGALRAEFGIAADAPLVALIARFQDVKGHDVFQDMARALLAHLPDARFIVAGENVHGVNADAAYKARILARWQADPLLKQSMRYIGFREDSERVIAAADVVVCSSHFESLGMVHLETMSSGRPIVSTRRGGPSETVLDGVTGLLADPHDPQALAEQVLRLLRDPALRATMGAAGRARVLEHFSARACADGFMDALDEALRARAAVAGR